MAVNVLQEDSEAQLVKTANRIQPGLHNANGSIPRRDGLIELPEFVVLVFRVLLGESGIVSFNFDANESLCFFESIKDFAFGRKCFRLELCLGCQSPAFAFGVSVIDEAVKRAKQLLMQPMKTSLLPSSPVKTPSVAVTLLT